MEDSYRETYYLLPQWRNKNLAIDLYGSTNRRVQPDEFSYFRCYLISDEFCLVSPSACGRAG
ncbi:hypothetical protein PPNK14_05380 [Pectobacterium parmentieri]